MDVYKPDLYLFPTTSIMNPQDYHVNSNDLVAWTLCIQAMLIVEKSFLENI